MLADEQTVQPRHLRGSRTNGLDLQWLGVTLPGGRNRAHEKKRKRQDAVEGHAQDSEGVVEGCTGAALLRVRKRRACRWCRHASPSATYRSLRARGQE